MRWLLVGILWAFASLLSQLWTAEGGGSGGIWTQDWFGPWDLPEGGGRRHLVWTYRGPAPDPAGCSLRLGDQPLEAHWETLPEGGVLRVSLDREATGLVTAQLGRQIQEVAVRPLPRLGARAGLVFLPASQDVPGTALQRLQERLGADRLLAILIGEHRRERLERLPPGLAVVALGDGADGPIWDRLAPGNLVPRHLAWGALGISWGQAGADWASLMAQDLSTWSVPVLSAAVWDPSLYSPRQDNAPDRLSEVVGLVAGLGQPLVLEAGSRIAFISEPMALAGGGLTRRSGGVRIASVTAPGGTVAGLVAELSAVVEDPAVVALVADPDRFDYLVLTATDDLVLTYRRDERPAGGWGGGDLHAAWKRYLADPQAPTDDLAWVLSEAYETMTLPASERETLMQGATDAQRRLIAKRLLSPMPQMPGEPDWLIRDRILRELGERSIRPGSLAWQAIAGGSDEGLVHAAIRCADGRARGIILDALDERLRRQAAGEVPLAADPLDQHRLVSAIFDAPDRSPSGLRDLARAIEPRLDPLSLGPVRRFFEINGRFRAP